MKLMYSIMFLLPLLVFLKIKFVITSCPCLCFHQQGICFFGWLKDTTSANESLAGDSTEKKEYCQLKETLYVA